MNSVIMTKKTILNLSNEKFLVELDHDPVWSRNGFDQGLLFLIKNKKGKTVGCLSTFISLTTRSIWNHQIQLTPEIIEDLFLRIIPHVQFKPNLSDFSSVYPECIQLYIDTRDDGYDEKHKIQILRGHESPQELVDHVIFNGEMNEEKVQEAILTYLYDIHLENLSQYTNTGILAKKLFVSEKIVFRCLQYLSDDGYVEGKSTLDSGGYAFSKITTEGVRYVRANFQKVSGGSGLIIMGDYIGNNKVSTHVSGNKNQTTVLGSVNNSLNSSVTNNKIEEFKTIIENEYVGSDKTELIEKINLIKNLSNNDNNSSKIRSILGEILTKTSEFAQIASLGIELFQLFTRQK